MKKTETKNSRASVPLRAGEVYLCCNKKAAEETQLLIIKRTYFIPELINMKRLNLKKAILMTFFSVVA
jgi:hypothetical protein